MNRNKTFGLLLAAAFFAGGELEMQAQWEERLGIKITLVTGEVKTHLHQKDATGLGYDIGLGWGWPDYRENYYSVEIPSGFDSIKYLGTSGASGIKTLQHVKMPSDWDTVEDIDISGTQLRTITIPPGLKELRVLSLSDNPLETIHFPSGNAGRLTTLGSIELENTNIETLAFPEGLLGLSFIDVRGCSRLHTIKFGNDTNEGVTIYAKDATLKRIVIPRRLERKVEVVNEFGDRGDWNHLEILYLEDLNPRMEIIRKGGVMIVRWNAGNLYASEQPEGSDWRLVGGVELSPLRIPAVLEGKMFFQVKPQE